MADESTLSDIASEKRAASPAPARRAVALTSAGKTSPRFYACVGLLILAAIGTHGAAGFLGGYFRKAAVPLKKPLAELDQSKLWPYEPHRIQPPPFTDEQVENLGTKLYLQWHLRDRSRNRYDPTSVVQLFVTYYTGQPDPVPHNPKECHAAGGMMLADETSIDVAVTGPDQTEVVIPVSVLEFELPGRSETLLNSNSSVGQRVVVSYFFYANGRYMTSRTAVRTAVANLWDRHAYYSKIEMSFTDDTYRRLPNTQQAIAATRRLLAKLMPILWEDHYQDWEAIKRGEPPVLAAE